MSFRYCPMCDDAVKGNPCPHCGADTERLNTRTVTRRESSPCPLCEAGDGPHTLAHEGKP